MRNIFHFIRRYINFLFFVVLQVLAIMMLVRYNKFHEAAFMNTAGAITGRFSERFDNVEYYFHLKGTNEALVKENEFLRNQLKQNFVMPDTAATAILDTIPYDTLGRLRKYMWRPAKVVNNSVSLQNNYFTIHRGEKQGVRKDMGVVSSFGVAGIVVNTSDNFAVVMSMLHRQSRVSAKIKKTGELGTVQWDGEDPLYVSMINVPKSVPVKTGDTIVTSQYSYLFPQGVMVGTIAGIIDNKASNFYTLRLKPATNFYTMEFVTVVENLQRDEQKALEEATKKTQ